MLDGVYKLRYRKGDRRRWEAAAALVGVALSQWIRDTLEAGAIEELLAEESGLMKKYTEIRK